MASIIKKIKKGRPYYYAVESKRLDGKPRIVWQKYLGTVEGMVARAEGARPKKPKEVVIFEAGGVAVLLRIAQRLDLAGLINELVPKRDQGPTVADYLVLAALNRALSPCSKVEIGEWYENTILRRLWRFPKSAFSSQRFWDHMGMVSEDAIERIQKQLVERIRSEFGLDSGLLLYDTTNFFTFLATSNGRAVLPQRGHSKAKRHDLRQVGLALMVTQRFMIPLLHRVYPGNVADVSLFSQISQELIATYNQLVDASDDMTLVFDKGNVSDDAMEVLAMQRVGFVAALSANRRKASLSTPLSRFEPVESLSGTFAFSDIMEVWGTLCRVVVSYTESFFTQQLAGVTNNLVKCQKHLSEVQKSLERWREGNCKGLGPTIKSLRKKVEKILSAQFMKDLFRVRLDEGASCGKSGQRAPHLHYEVDHAALTRLTNERLGRTVLVTNHLNWSPEQVILAYRGLARVEESFKHMKNTAFLHWQPAYHWTDQKLKVHGFYCVLALLLATLACKEASEAGIDLSLPAMLKELSAIREVAIIYPKGTLARPKNHIAISRMSPRQRKLAEALDIASVLNQ
jgi:transposase